MRKSVTQEDALACGAACLSFIANTSYKEVVRKLNKSLQKGYYCKDLVGFLEKVGLPYTYKYLKPAERHKIYQEGVIVYIQKSVRYPAGHYLVRHRNLWMDPWINFPKINKAKSGFRKRLPGKPIYIIFPTPSLAQSKFPVLRFL